MGLEAARDFPGPAKEKGGLARLSHIFKGGKNAC